MPVKALDLTGQKISKTEAAVFFIEPQDMVTQSEIAAPLELGGYPASGAAASADMAQIYPHQWYASWRSSTANMLIVTWKTREQAIAAPGEPSEKELLESWNRYYEEHWDELVAKYNGKYVAILEDTVFDSDEDLAALAERVYASLGYRSVFMPYIGKRRGVAEFLSPL